MRKGASTSSSRASSSHSRASRRQRVSVSERAFLRAVEHAFVEELLRFSEDGYYSGRPAISRFQAILHSHRRIARGPKAGSFAKVSPPED